MNNIIYIQYYIISMIFRSEFVEIYLFDSFLREFTNMYNQLKNVAITLT